MFRIIRVLEYSFEDFATYEKHMREISTPATGVITFGKITIRSSTTPVEYIAFEDTKLVEEK